MRQCFSLAIPIESQFSCVVPAGTRVNAVFYTPSGGPQLNCDAPDTAADQFESLSFFVVPELGLLQTDVLTVFVGQFQATPHGRPFSIFMALNRKAAS